MQNSGEVKEFLHENHAVNWQVPCPFAKGNV